MPATDPTALLRSIGAPPLRARSDMAEAYLVAVAERAAGLATALAAAADLLAGRPERDDDCFVRSAPHGGGRRTRRRSHDGEGDLDVAAGGVRVGADLVGLGHESSAVARSSAGACTSSSTASPKPPRSFIPMPTDADTSVPVTSSLSRPATTLMAEWKHAA